jgi:hypothetical protein
MTMQTTTARKCSRCGTAIDICAFCDRPDCPAITCSRCVSVAFLDRLRSKPTTTSATRR